MTAAEAAGPSAKEEVWRRIHEGGYTSLRVVIAAMGAFWQRSQRVALERFVPRFFSTLPEVFDDWEPEAARAYFTNLFPWHRIEQSTRDMVSDLAERGDIGPVLRRLLVEAGDDLERAVACREFATQSAEVGSAADLVE